MPHSQQKKVDAKAKGAVCQAEVQVVQTPAFLS